jgi:signal transduction histidine kinase
MMPAQNIPYVIALLITSAICAAVVAGAWQRRGSRAAASFTALMAMVFVWSAGFALQLAVPSLAAQQFWTNVYFIGVVCIPPLWFIFAARYTGFVRWLTRQNYFLLFIMPALTLLIIFTNERHHLFWQGASLLDTPELYMWETTRAGWFWVHTAYSYALLLGGVALLMWAAFGRAQLYRGQVAALFVAVGAPFLANAIYLAGLSPWPIDLTPFAFTVTGLAILWGLFRVQLFDVLPAARDAVLESMTDGVIVLDARNRVIDINRAARTFLANLNPAAGEIIGQDVRDVLSPWPGLVEKYINVTSAQTSLEVPVPGGTYHLEMRISSLRDREGRVSGRVIVSSDVTASRRAERLQQAKEAAEASSQAKSAFLANMSHELRTPLNHIIGYSEMLIEEAEGGGQDAADLLKIRNAGRDLLKLVNSVLEISRLDAGMVTLQREDFAADDLAEEAAQMAQAAIAARGLAFHLSLPPEGLGIVQGDPDRLRQCLLHLLDNAAKFTENGEVRFSASRTGGLLTFTVADTGIGMDAAQVAGLFEPFALGDASNTRQHGGAGLGLATTRRLTDLMGGSLAVESAPGSGSTFTLTIPVVVK